MSPEAIAIIAAAGGILGVLVPLQLTIRADVRRLDDRLSEVEIRLQVQLREVETRLDERLRAVETRLDDRLRNVETELAFLSGRRQEEPAPPPATPAGVGAGSRA